jgi:hypothetical protein
MDFRFVLYAGKNLMLMFAGAENRNLPTPHLTIIRLCQWGVNVGGQRNETLPILRMLKCPRDFLQQANCVLHELSMQRPGDCSERESGQQRRTGKGSHFAVEQTSRVGQQNNLGGNQMTNTVIRNPGQVAYDTYCNHTGWKSLVSGADLPQWKDVKPEIQAAWTEAGLASIHYCKDIVCFKYPKVRAALENLCGASTKGELQMMEHMMSEMEQNEDVQKSIQAIQTLLTTLEDGKQ